MSTKQQYSHAKADARQERRRDEATRRQDIYEGLSLEEKIRRAKKRRGENKRELTRLQAKVKAKANPKA